MLIPPLSLKEAKFWLSQACIHYSIVRRIVNECQRAIFGYFAVLNSDNALGGAGNRVVVGDKNYGSSSWFSCFKIAKI